MQASELIREALRLINVPGRGASLSGPDELAAFASLKQILNSEVVSKQFQPGIRQHFFELTSAKSQYTYGPGQDLDTDDFFDKAPIKLEYAQLRTGTTIQRNEIVDEWQFDAVGAWAVAAGHALNNGMLQIRPGATGSTSQGSIPKDNTGIVYVVRVEIVHRTGSLDLDLWDGSGQLVDQTISGTGTYEFEFTPTVGNLAIYFINSGLTDDLDVLSCSVIPKGLDRVSLPDAQGTDYKIRIIDQKTYNFAYTKGLSSRPDELHYSRNYPNGLIRFDNAPTAGEILLLDVLVNQLELDSTADTINLHDDAIRYVKYALADEEAAGYGKALTRRQLTIMREAKDMLQAGNARPNNLRVDKALQRRRQFSINRGDP